MTTPQDDLTMASHARAIARQARALEMETGEPSNPLRPGSVTDLNRLVTQLADIVAELADRAGPEELHWGDVINIAREDDLR